MAAVGVPMMRPLLESVNPAGGAPLKSDQVNAFGRQHANRVDEKFCPITATPRSLLLMLTVDVPPPMNSPCVNFASVLPAASLTRRVIANEPFSTGVPVMFSVPASNESPAGRAPSIIEAL